MEEKDHNVDVTEMVEQDGERFVEVGKTLEGTEDDFANVGEIVPPTKKYYHDITLEEADRIIVENIKDAVRNVIAIGYYLKHIRDKELYLEAGFEDIWSYASDKYGFSKSTTSRYMSRNDRFSVDGNSPILAPEFREYSKAQLQEMLSLNEEQMAQVSPEMSVREIREVKKPKEIPYYEIPGQQNFAEYFGVEEQVAEKVPEVKIVPGVYTMNVAELFPNLDPEDVYRTLPGRIQSKGFQQFSEEPQRSNVCLYRPDKMCTLLDIHKLIPGDGTNCTEKCCWECTANEGCNIKCYSAASRTKLENPVVAAPQQLSAYGTKKKEYPPESLIATEGCEGGHNCFSCAMDCTIRSEERFCRYAALGNPFPCEQMECLAAIKYSVGMECQFINHDLAPHTRGTSEAEPCCKTCENPCEYICERAEREQCNITAEYDRNILLNLIKSEEEILGAMQDYWKKEQPHTYVKHRMMIDAYKLLLGHHDELVVSESIEQPELPILKNNDQRKEWINNYKEWPVWFEVPEASETYYRYDFEDGSSFVICEYRYYIEWLATYSAGDPEKIGKYEYILKPGYRYLQDCSSNMTAMIDHLKEVQKR